ncbi:hypothetical protein NC661_07710 [Aquibacillus koreensis]|uniref:Uncharacterized protein n=1 Tax=Aquibacillus koreensis TaxID=279446 RepID=A0A9X3WMX2_9BACI|nr:hypothetical protein [Aquibacillus koreensis]MCT2535801.1 hypothetical protein [Aquibacillus koreensis]MDC3420256.1 hypothetical protein [Aquibacillus koreensis]
MKKNNVINNKSIPFFLLAAIHSLLLLLLLKRHKQRNVWFLFLTNTGFAYLFEYIILNLFRGYKYKPSIFKNRHVDAVFGAIFSQALYVPISATFLTLCKMKWYWKVIISIFYYVIEKFFIWLRVYKVNWWKPVYTFVLLNVYFYISDRFYLAFSKNRKWALAITHYLSIEVIYVSFLYASAIRRKVRFGRGNYHSWKEHFIIVPLYSLFISFIAMRNSGKPGLIKRISLIVYQLLIDFTLAHWGFLKLNTKYLLGALPVHIVMTFLSRFIYIKVYRKQGDGSAVSNVTNDFSK